MVSKKHSLTTSNALSILSIGGCCRIGLNCTIYKTFHNGQESWILVDFGLGFAEKHLGLDILLPDIHFLKRHKHLIKGICITHGHEDHIGAIPYMWEELNVPIYATGFTKALIEEKTRKSLPIKEVHPNVDVACGSFKMQWINVAHSIPESHALLIETPCKKRVLHTGDFKTNDTSGDFSYFDESAFRALGNTNILAMICDSTNAHLKHQTSGEKSLKCDLTKQIKSATQRIAITLFSSNVERLHSILSILKKERRDVALVGRSVQRIFDVAQRKTLLPSTQILSPSNAMSRPREKIAFICAGSQGEERSALTQIAYGKHPSIHLEEGDCVLYSSRTIPGNEKEVGDVKNAFASRGIRIIDHYDGHIHASGHPAQEDLTRMYRLVCPRFSIPVHGEAYHISAHKRLVEEKSLAHKVILLKEGQEIMFPDPLPHDFFPMKKSVAIKTLCLDGRLLIPDNHPIISERRMMARSGVVIITIFPQNLHEKNQSMLGVLSFIGIPEEIHEPAEKVFTLLTKEIQRKDKQTNHTHLENMIKKKMQTFFYARWKKIPLIKILFPFHNGKQMATILQ